MTPEEHSLLERTYKIAEENNEILRAMKRSARLANVMRIIYWVVIVALSVGAYYLIQPYAELLFKLGGGSITNVQSAANSLQDLLK